MSRALALLVLTLLVSGCGTVAADVAPSPSPSPTASPSPSPTVVFVPNADDYFRRIARYDFVTPPTDFNMQIVRTAGPMKARGLIASYVAHSVLRDGVQLPVFVASYVIDPAAPGRETVLQDFETGLTSTTPDATIKQTDLHGLPARIVTVPLATPVTVIVWTQGLYLLTVYSADATLGSALADALVGANSGRV